MQGHASARAGRRRVATGIALFAAVMAVVMAVVVGRALADAPILQSVELPLYQNHPTFHWSLPTGDKGTVQSEFIETATGSGTGAGDGHFLQKNLLTFTTLGPTDTSFTDTREYKPGTYYVHVAGHDPKCVAGACEPIQFSDVLSFDVVAPPPPPGGGGGTGDTLAPLQTLSFSAVQDVDKLRVTTRATEAGTVTATGTVSVSGASKVYRFKRASRSVAANVKTTLRLKLAKKSLRAVKRALKKHKRLKAKLTLTASDKAGNKRSAKVTIGLKN